MCRYYLFNNHLILKLFVFSPTLIIINNKANPDYKLYRKNICSVLKFYILQVTQNIKPNSIYVCVYIFFLKKYL